MADVFVFGSNREGRHGKGAALVARQQYGAIYGQPAGRQGNSYAIPTKELRKDFPPVTLDEIKSHIHELIEHAIVNPWDTFHVTRIGCGLAGFTPQQIAPLFKGGIAKSGLPVNIILPDEFLRILYP